MEEKDDVGEVWAVAVRSLRMEATVGMVMTAAEAGAAAIVGAAATEAGEAATGAARTMAETAADAVVVDRPVTWIAHNYTASNIHRSQ